MIRYDPTLSSDPYHSHEYAVMEVEPQGEYVSYEDYQLLTSKIAELEAELENTRTQSQWISDQLAPALNKCFKSKIGCDGMLMVAVDDYNELVDLINKASAPKEQGQ